MRDKLQWWMEGRSWFCSVTSYRGPVLGKLVAGHGFQWGHIALENNRRERKRREGRCCRTNPRDGERLWRGIVLPQIENCLSTVWKDLPCSWHSLWHLTFVLLWAPHSQLFLSTENSHGTKEVASDQRRGANLKEEGKVYTYENNDVGLPFGS